MAFDDDEQVVHPAHGVAEIVGRERRKFQGETVTFVVLAVPARDGISSAMRVSVPEDRAEELGLRAVISADEAAEVLEVLGMRNVRVPSNWSRRFKNHQEKLRSGDLYQCAEVVRNLAHRERDGKLSTAERSMYLRARYLLTTELAVSWGVEPTEAETRVDGALWANASKS